jgi:enamine deaminase RidA (YjgF/YER057c/UK114 family)
MHKVALAATSAPPPSAHLSCAVLSQDAGVLFVSGALGIKCGEFVEGTVADRFYQAMDNVHALLAEADFTLSDGKLCVGLRVVKRRLAGLTIH